VVVLDQALYAKACEVAWKHKDLYAGNFSTNFQPSIHNWQTVPRRWFARYLHWIRNNRRRFSLRRPRRRCTVRVHKRIYQALLQEGNWLLHLYAVHHMIPWFFAYDKFNYARYLVYYAQMANLLVDHRHVHWNFMEGHFFCAASRWESVWEDSRGSHHWRNRQQRHNDNRDHDKIQLEDRHCK